MSRRSASQIHESFARDTEIRSSSDRAFGFVFTVVFGLIGLAPLWRGAPPRWWNLAVAAVFLVAALLVPRVRSPLPLDAVGPESQGQVSRVVSPVCPLRLARGRRRLVRA